MPEIQTTSRSHAVKAERKAKRTRRVKSSLAGATAVAVGFSGAMLAATPAMAAPGYAEAEATYLSGSLLNIPLETIAELQGERAVAPYGSEGTVTESNNLNLEVLDGVLMLEVADGIMVPISLADAGVVGQFAQASPAGDSRAVAGLVTSEGVVNVNPDGSNPPGPLTFDLSDLLGDEVTEQISGLTLTTGVNTASAEQAAGGTPVGTYNIADLDLTLTSPVVADLSGAVTDAATPLQASVDAVVGAEGSLVTELTGLLDLGEAVVISDVSLDVDLPAVVADVVAENQILGEDGPVTVNLADGTVLVDVAALLAANGMDLNDLDPNTELLTTELVGFITAEVDSLVNGMLAEVDEAVATALDAAVLNVDVTVGDEADPLLTVALNGSLAEIADGTVVGDVVIGDAVVLDSALVNAVLSGAVDTLRGLELNTAAVDAAIDGLYPLVDDVLTGAVSLVANGQETADGTFTQTSLRLTVLDYTAADGEALLLNLAQASVGPNAAVVEPDATAISGFTPTSGPEAGGTVVTITGDGFAGAEEVLFGDTPATDVVVVSDEEIRATSPAGTGMVALTVTGTDSGDVVSDSMFTYIPDTGSDEPIIVGIVPATGPEAGGTDVTITGDNFTGVEEVLFGDTPATNVVVVSDEVITATTPAGVGTVDVAIVDSEGNPIASDVTFTYIPEAGAEEPVVASITPATGPEAGGTDVTITGDNFTGVEEVLFGDVPATNVVVVSDEQITATTPAGVGTVDVAVVDAAGDPVASEVTFTYIPAVNGDAPVITTFTPDSGPVTGGTEVIIIGDNFTGVEEVLFGETPAAEFVVVSDGEIRAVSPEGTVGEVSLTVVGPDGEGTLSSGEFAYEAVTPPTPVDPNNPVTPVDPNNPVVPVTPVDPGNGVIVTPINNPGVVTTPTGVEYANCAAAEAAGAAPLQVGDPGYSLSLDGDADGTACENGSTTNLTRTGADLGGAGWLAAGLGGLLLLGGALLLSRKFRFQD